MKRTKDCRKSADTVPPPIRRAMVLAAGLGKRMRPITDTLPKPLVPVCGKPLIDYALDRLASAGIEDVVINVHYLADQIERHVAGRISPKVSISDEREQLLETAGGIVKALPLLAPDGREAFLSLNSDSLWIEGARPNLCRLIGEWSPDAMDILLLLAPTATSVGYDGYGDFSMDPEGRLQRRVERQMAPFVYAGVAILKPELFADVPAGSVSLNFLFDRAIERQRLFGLRLDGRWLHVGTPEAITEAEECIVASVR